MVDAARGDRELKNFNPIWESFKKPKSALLGHFQLDKLRSWEQRSYHLFTVLQAPQERNRQLIDSGRRYLRG